MPCTLDRPLPAILPYARTCTHSRIAKILKTNLAEFAPWHPGRDAMSTVPIARARFAQTEWEGEALRKGSCGNSGSLFPSPPALVLPAESGTGGSPYPRDTACRILFSGPRRGRLILVSGLDGPLYFIY